MTLIWICVGLILFGIIGSLFVGGPVDEDQDYWHGEKR